MNSHLPTLPAALAETKYGRALVGGSRLKKVVGYVVGSAPTAAKARVWHLQG